MKIGFINSSFNVKNPQSNSTKIASKISFNGGLSKDVVNFSNVFKTQFKTQIKKFPQDNIYRRTIAKAFGIKEGDEYILRPIIGLQEFTNALKAFKEKNYKPFLSEKIKNMDFRGNLHCHSKHSSDGALSTEEILNQAVVIADRNAKTLTKSSPAAETPFIIAITDHNELESCIEAVNLIKENPFKYRNLRVILGVEISTYHKNWDSPDAHVLLYGLHPYDKKLNEEAPKSINFTDVVSHLSSIEYGTMGIAHPARLINGNPETKSVEAYFEEYFDKFKHFGKDKAQFVENYYQSYGPNQLKHADIIKKISKKMGFISTGGIDSHGASILTS